MKQACILILLTLFLFSCNNQNKNNTAKSSEKTSSDDRAQGYFPVTEFLKGQITEIIQAGINPVKIIITGKKKDSIWLKAEDLNKEFSEFLSPEIDSSNMMGLFTEKKFLDQTIDAFTFTYDPKGVLPNSMMLQHWDVYIDPQKGTVKRVYLVKNTKENNTLQLTWITDKNCKITNIINQADGKSYVAREILINWDF